MRYIFKIFTYVRSLWPYYAGIIALGFLTTGLSLLIPYILKLATDVIVSAGADSSPDYTPIIWLAVLFLFVDIATTLIQNWSGYLGDIMSIRLRQTLSNRYYEHLLDLPQSYYDGELTGKIINRLSRTISEVTRFINAFANNFFSMYLTLIVSIVILLFYSWQLALMMTIIYPIFLALTTKTSKNWQVWQKKINNETDIASGRFAEVIAQIRVVKSFITEKLEYKSFASRNARTVSLTRHQSAYWHKMDIGRRLILNVIFAGALLYVLANTLNGRFSIGDLVFLVTLMNQMRMPVFNMSFIIDSLQRAIAGSRDYFEIMAVQSSVVDSASARKLAVSSGRIEYRDVSFGYGKEHVLSGINFTIDADEKVAIIGESGEGKTTLSSLLLRLYDVSSGRILIDDQAISDVTKRSLRESISVVFQDPSLFSGTIRENIAYARKSASEDEIIEAAKAANAYDFIMKFEGGFDATIGERGLKLSGGQKQRIAIARAILKQAPILVLDEATSSLDSRAEREVQQALDRLMKKHTTLIIAHRLSTIASVDKIITLKDGRVDEIGTPKDLAVSGGIYNQLLDLQLSDTERSKKKLQKFDIASE